MGHRSGSALPSIGRLVTLTDDIRKASQKAEELCERLILIGRADLIEQPDGFFRQRMQGRFMPKGASRESRP